MKALPVLLALSAATAHAGPALTLYNQNFAVVRETVPLDLKKGANTVSYSEATAQIETSSVILRDPKGAGAFQLIEQNYRNDPVSQARMLALYEGQTIDFVVREPQKPDRVVSGKIIRSGYVPVTSPMSFGPNPYHGQMPGAPGAEQPVIEVDGKIQFGLPGLPLFPALGDETILKPTLTWLLDAPEAVKVDAELAYLTGGMSWQADYNLVLPEKGNTLTLTGWITMNNQSGRTFRDASVKLMAGDVSKIQQAGPEVMAMTAPALMRDAMAKEIVTEKSFDEYHLYELGIRTTLRDRESKQVEFLNASGIKSRTIYVYDGLWLDPQRFRGWGYDAIRTNPEYGTESNTKVWVMREFKNDKDNGLGIPLPKGRMRFFRTDTDGQLEFIGETDIDHTPKDEVIRAYTGNAFDIVGERIRTDFKVDSGNKWADESFKIILKNRKEEPVEVRVVEHLYRWSNWNVVQKSHPFTKKDAQTIEFTVPLKPDEEVTVTYQVHYSW